MNLSDYKKVATKHVDVGGTVDEFVQKIADAKYQLVKEGASIFVVDSDPTDGDGYCGPYEILVVGYRAWTREEGAKRLADRIKHQQMVDENTVAQLRARGFTVIPPQ